MRPIDALTHMDKCIHIYVHSALSHMQSHVPPFDTDRFNLNLYVKVSYSFYIHPCSKTTQATGGGAMVWEIFFWLTSGS